MILKNPQPPRIHRKGVDTRDEYDDLLREKDKRLKDLQMKLMILSKGYYELRESVTEKDSKLQRMELDGMKLASTNQSLETLLEKEQRRFEKEKKEIIESLPSLQELRALKSEKAKLSKKIARDSEIFHQEVLRVRKGRKALEVKFRRVKRSRDQLKEKNQKMNEELTDTREKLEKTVILNEEGNRKKLDSRNKMSMKCSNLSRVVSKKNEIIEKMKKEISELKDKVVKQREWSKTLEVENSKTMKEFLNIQNKMYKMERELEEEYRNSQQREDLIEKLRRRNHHLRQSFREVPKEVDEDQIDNEETIFLSTIRSQVDDIDDTLREVVREGV